MIWEQANKTATIVVALLVLGFAFLVFKQIQGCVRPTPSQTTLPGKPPDVVKPPLSENSSLVPEPKDRIGGRLRTIRTPRPTATSPNPKPDTLDAWIPLNPRQEPPSYQWKPGDSAAADVRVEWQPVRNPYLEFKASLFLGASADLDAKISPWGGVSGIRAFDILHVGIGVDLKGLGPFLGAEVLQNLNLAGEYRLVKFNQTAADFLASLSYKF